MSHNQSRGEKTEPHLRKPGRPGIAGQTRGLPGGGGGRGGGGFAPPVPSPAPSDAPGRSFRKPGNVQGGQPRGHSAAGVNAAAAAGNGPQSQPPFQFPGTHDAPVPMAPKPVEVSAPKPSRAVPRPPSGPGDSTMSAGKGDASKPFTLQFGSITPGFVNGMPIPARTSSAPPNLDEQKRDQASHAMYGASSSMIPVSSVLKQQSHLPHKEVIGPGSTSSGNSHPTLEVKKDNTAQVSTPLSMPSQKSSGVSVPGVSMPMFQQQPQMPLQFGGPNITMQSPHVTASSMQMPMPQMPMASSPQMFVPSIQPHVVLQGQGLGFPTHMGHRMPSTLGNVGMGMGTQYSQQQTGQFGASRKTSVRITHPVTHEELRLDKKMESHIDTSGQRSNIPPQTQPPPFPAPPINIFQNPQGAYAPGLYYPPLPLGSSQPAVSQPSRFNFPVAQSGTPVSIVNPSTLTSVSVSKPGMTIQKDSEQSHVGQSQGGKVISISAPAPAQVTVKAAVSIAPDVGTAPAGSGTAVVKDGGPRVAKPSQEASLMSQQKVSAVGSEVPGGHLKGREAESEVAGSHLNSSVKSTGASLIPTDNQLPELASSVDQKTEPHIATRASTPVTESISSPSHLNVERKQLLISEPPKNDKKKTEIEQRHLKQEQMEDLLDSSSSSNVLFSSLLKEGSSSTSSVKHIQEYSEDVNLVSKTIETPKDSRVSLTVDGGSSESGASKGDIAHIIPDPLGLPEVESGLKDAQGKPLSPHPMTNGAIPSEESTTNDFGVAIPCQESDSQLDVKKCQETLEIVETSESAAHDTSFHGSKGERGMTSLLKPSHCNDLLPDVTEEDISKQAIAPEHLGGDGNLNNVNGVLAGVRSENNGVVKEDVESKIQSVSRVDSSSNLSVHEAKTEHIPESNATTVNSPRPLLHSVVSDSDSSNKNQKLEEKTIEAGGQASRSSSLVKDKPAPEANRAKTNTGKKKKKKEMLSRADAAGTNSDLYMAYKKPEEQQVASVPSDVTDSSSIDDGKKLQVDETERDITIKEDGQSKTDIDDWEDAVEMPSPKLEAPEKSGRYNIAKKLGHEFGGVNSRKKYSRDFLLTFSDQCIDLPTGLEIGSDVAPLFSAQVGASHLLNNEMLSGHARIIDRPNPTNRADRRMVNYMDDEKWTKATNVPSSRDGGFRGGPGATHGVLRNPRAQGGILPGQMQPLAGQGVPRGNIDAERWQRASSLRGLMPSPQTPAQVMHKAEKKYEVGKVSDEEDAKQRQIKAILNKLTPQNFDRLFQQVKEVNIDSADTLTGVISQIFDKALAEPTFCEMYANFCLHLAGALPDFIEGNEKITFKRLLLNKCQEEFERGEREQAEADKVEEEGEVKQSEEEKEEMRIKARRRMLGNIRLIGELYKKRMLTERIMHECIKKLLGQHQNPDEEDIEALCKLMSTIGEMIDHVKAKEHMDAYFDIMKNLSLNQKLSSRVRFMLKDAIDLRKNNWQQRRKVEGPKKIEEVHRAAAQERAHAGRSVRGSGIGSSTRKGPPIDYGSRSSMPPSSGAPQVASLRNIPAQVRGFGSQDVRMDDKHLYESRTLSVPLSQRPLGDDSITLGPQGGLAKGMSSRGQPLMPHPPVADVSSTGESTRRMVLGPNGHSSISDRNVYIGIRDLGRADRNYDRSMSKTSLEQNLSSSAGSTGTSPQSVSFSEEQLHDKSISAIREYYSAKDEKEIGLCIKELNSPCFYPTMVSLWVTDSFERKDIERELLSKLLVSLCKPGDRLLSREQLIQGFEQVLSTLEDAVTDAPRAAEFVGWIFVRSILEEVVTFQEIGRLLHEGGEEPGRLLEIGLAADVLGSVLEIIKTEKGDATVKVLRTSSSLPLESFRPPHPMKSRKLEQFL